MTKRSHRIFPHLASGRFVDCSASGKWRNPLEAKAFPKKIHQLHCHRHDTAPVIWLWFCVNGKRDQTKTIVIVFVLQMNRYLRIFRELNENAFTRMLFDKLLYFRAKMLNRLAICAASAIFQLNALAILIAPQRGFPNGNAFRLNCVCWGARIDVVDWEA